MHQSNNIFKHSFNKEDWLWLGLLFIVTIILFFPALGSFGILDPSEAYYSESAREMLEKNEWIVPLLNYQPWFEKPILNYWLIESSYKILGVNEFASRLPAALLGSLLILLTYIYTRMFVPRRIAILSSLILATSSLYLVVGHLSLTDMPFTVFLSIALFNFLTLYLQTKHRQLFFYLGYISLGLAILAKGPLALIICGIILATYICTANNSIDIKALLDAQKRLNLWMGLCITLLVACPWYLAVTNVTHGGFAQEFFIKQNLGRAAGTVDHQAPFWYYLPYLAAAFPWSIFIFALPKLLTRLIKKEATLSNKSSIIRFASIWFGLIFIILSFISTKLPTYILPVFPGLAILLAVGIDSALKIHKGKILIWTGPVLFIISSATTIFMPMLLHETPHLVTAFTIATGIISTGFFIYSLSLLFKKSQLALISIISSTIIAEAALVPLSLQVFWTHHESGFQELLETAKNAGNNIALYGSIQSSTFYFFKRHIPLIHNKKDIDKFITSNSAPYLFLTLNKHIEDIKQVAEAENKESEVIKERHHWALVEVK